MVCSLCMKLLWDCERACIRIGRISGVCWRTKWVLVKCCKLLCLCGFYLSSYCLSVVN